MENRTRTRNLMSTFWGSVENQNGDAVAWQSCDHGSWERCDDTVGNREGFNNLDIDFYTRSGGTLTGVRRDWQGNVDRVFNDFPIAAASIAPPDPNWEYAMSPTRLNEYVLRLLASTAPDRSEVNFPQFVGELKDLPGMIRGWGRHILKYKNDPDSIGRLFPTLNTSANSWLTWKWGIKPMISDLSTLLDIQAKAEIRFKDLDRLRKGIRLGRRLTLDSRKKRIDSSRFIVNSNQVLFDGYWRDVFSDEVWGSVQWYTPSWSNISKSDDAELRLRAKKIVLGMTSKAATEALWELVPWSWLADWFSNCGDVLTASRNSLDYAYRGVCIMQKCSVDRVLKHNNLVWGNYELAMTPLELHRTRKYRFANPIPVYFPTLRLPVFTTSKLSIIGSLAVLRFPEGTRHLFKSS